MQLPYRYHQQRKLEDLVENRTTFTVDQAELNIYETHHFAEEVVLAFNQPVFASMLEGKKIMHLRDQDPFDFLPGQSLIMPANEVMKIDFPEADIQHPTKCLAMTIAAEKIRSIVEEMNYTMPRIDDTEWEVNDHNFCFTNSVAISQIIQRLIFLFAENHRSKDMFVNLMLKELVIRVMQADARNLYDELSAVNGNGRLKEVVKYIRENLDRNLSVRELSQQACMSEPNFYRVFRHEMGVSPTQYVNEQRIRKAGQLLQDPQIQIKEVFAECGFNNFSYFTRSFKKVFGKSPKAYQMEEYYGRLNIKQ